jgi:hypothetical protein
MSTIDVISGIPDEELDAIYEFARSSVEGKLKDADPATIGAKVNKTIVKYVTERVRRGDVKAYQHDAESRVDYRNLAVHETGHAIVAAGVGVRVNKLIIDSGMGGSAFMDQPRGPMMDISISVAGYVAVCVVNEKIPSSKGFFSDSTAYYDIDDAKLAAEDGRIAGTKPITRAIAKVYKYLSQEAVRAKLEEQAKLLAKTRRLDGRVF